MSFGLQRPEMDIIPFKFPGKGKHALRSGAATVNQNHRKLGILGFGARGNNLLLLVRPTKWIVGVYSE
jgi:hypothetical protein